MSELPVCRHCGYFIQYQIPKEPAKPGWAHTGHSPTKPVGPPCDTPEPLRVHPGDPRPTTDGPVVWDSAAPRAKVRIRAYHGDSGSVLVGDATAITRDGIQGYRVICDGLLEEVVIWCGPWHVVQLP